MSKFSLSQRERVIIVIFLLSFLIFVIYTWVYKPLADQASLFKDKVKSAERNLRKNLKTIDESEALKKKYEAILKSFKQTTSDEEIMSSILSEIESAANKINLRLADMKTRKPRKIDFYNNFSVSLAIDAELADILNFIHILQNPPYLFSVEELQLSKNSPRITALRCQMVLSRILTP